MPDETRKERHAPQVLATLAGVLAAFLLVAACYVGWQAVHILFPQNVYETALPAVVSDAIDADGVLLFEESYVAGSGTLGYLAADGERVSAGTAVAEIYSDASQAVLRQQLTQLTDQIDLLQRSQNTSALQLDTLLKDRSSALYDLMDTLDDGDYEAVSDSADAYLLAQNKLWIVTGDAANFTDQIAALAQQAQTVQAQLGNPTQITAPQTGYFVRASSSGRLNAGAEDILALSAQELKGYLDSDPVLALDGCAGKIVSGFTWRYVGVCSAKEGEKLLGQDGKPRRTAVEISFPGRVETALKATVTDVTIDADNDLARFVLTCNSINGDVLCLNKAAAKISGGGHRPAGADGCHPLFKGRRHRSRGQGRKLHPGRVCQVRQYCPLLQDRPGGRRPPAHHPGRIYPRFAQGDRWFGESGAAL